MPNLHGIPQVDALARDHQLARFSPSVAVAAARAAIAESRELALRGEEVRLETVVVRALRHAERLSRSAPQPVVNLSGVVLHTGLGRARLAPAVARRVAEVAAGHAAVEFDLEAGSRGDRQDHLRWLLRQLTGAPDAHVVNNCAGAVVLALAALANGRQVLLSRGQMVEIGGAFRMPDIVAQSGCRLVEVGCTNKTRLSDYAERVGPDVAAILRCHPSNFAMVGFTEEPEAAELAKLAKASGALLIDDVGSGCLVDTTRFGLPKEPTLQDAVRAGADLVLCSGDKLLGGPQAGIILGSTECVAQVRRHPLSRALRVDKLTLTALEATLRLYLEGRELEIPVWASLAQPLDALRRLARRLARCFPGAAVAPGRTEAGGGSLPGASVSTWRVRLPHPRPADLARVLRQTYGVVGRIEDDAVWLDPRTLDRTEVPQVEKALSQVAAHGH